MRCKLTMKIHNTSNSVKPIDLLLKKKILLISRLYCFNFIINQKNLKFLQKNHDRCLELTSRSINSSKYFNILKSPFVHKKFQDKLYSLFSYTFVGIAFSKKLVFSKCILVQMLYRYYILTASLCKSLPSDIHQNIIIYVVI